MTLVSSCFFFFNDTATTEIYTLSLHDALPICRSRRRAPSSSRRRSIPAPSPRSREVCALPAAAPACAAPASASRPRWRSEEHTSELQSQSNLVCRLLLEKKKLQLASVLSGIHR